jgi:hypothetical protein
MRNAVLATLAIVFAASCSTNPAAKAAAVGHSSAIRGVVLGQTMYQIRQVMKADPQTRTRRVTPDGHNQEEWGYVTDYGNDVITQITFTDRMVTEIRQMAWRGEYASGTISPGEDLRTPNEIADETANKAIFRKIHQANIDNASEVIKVGQTVEDVRRLLGEPSLVSARESFRNVTIVEQTFHRSDGHEIIVTIRASRVTGVSGQH